MEEREYLQHAIHQKTRKILNPCLFDMYNYLFPLWSTPAFDVFHGSGLYRFSKNKIK